MGGGGRVGTGSLLGAAIGRYTDAEQPLAADLLGCFGPGMLVLADRKFLSWAAACVFLATGAHILWRASASFTLKPVRALADGTYLAELKPPRKSDGPPVTVRVIEYKAHTPAADGTGQTSEVFCLVTDLLDPISGAGPGLRLSPALGLRDHHRLPQDRHGRRPARAALRRPRGVMQEMCALFAVYQAITRLIGIAVDAAGIPLDRISFSHALAAATAIVAAFPLTRSPSPSPRSWPRSSCPPSSSRPPGPGQPAEDQEGRRLAGEPSVTRVTGRIEFHLLYPWRVT